MKIGIFAGTFDPIHNGHLAFAQAAINEAQLDKVVIVAEKSPYRKQPFASWDHRQAMIERATEGINKVDHDYQFANQLAHQHTMQDMLSVAELHYGANNEFWFLVGSDIFEHMHQWQQVAKAEDYGGFIVTLHRDHTEDWLNQKLADTSLKVIIIQNRQPAISSTTIRRAAGNHQRITITPSKVANYILQHNLYS